MVKLLKVNHGLNTQTHSAIRCIEINVEIK